MIGDDGSDTRLREALAELAEAAGEGKDCLDPERLWLSGRRELDAAENEAVLLHVARCPSCAMAWRIAKDLSPGAASELHLPARRPLGPRGWIGLAAAAAVVVATIGLGIRFMWPPGPDPGTVFRTQEGAWLESALDEEASLPRADFVLRWAAGPEGTFYDVLVTTDKLETIAQGAGLKTPEFQVPEEALEDLAPGTSVLWQVDARLPDGRQVESETFIVRLE